MERRGYSSSPYIAGLTGGIGSGKTTVTRMFADLGAEIIDADEVSRALLQPGSKALDAVAAHFGGEVMNGDNLDRGKLREIVFSDEHARQWLENLLHPLIRQEILRRIRNSPASWLILSVPLLLESNAYDFADCVIVIDSPESVQIARTAERDKVSEEQVRSIMARQMSREERLLHADHILYNDADLGHLQRQVSSLFEKLENYCHARP